MRKSDTNSDLTSSANTLDSCVFCDETIDISSGEVCPHCGTAIPLDVQRAADRARLRRRDVVEEVLVNDAGDDGILDEDRPVPA